MNADRKVLLLEDGTAFEGLAFGAEGHATGEVVAYTGVVGTQEVLTTPSYRGTLLVLTYPIIGSTGVNAEDHESAQVHPRGLVVRDHSATPSNFRATGTLEDFLREHGVVGIRGVDTRAVAVHLREQGEMRAAIVPAEAPKDQALAELRAAPSPFGRDLVGQLAPAEPLDPVDGARHKVAVLDLGVPRSLLAQLAQLGCRVHRLPPDAAADPVAAADADALIVAGGPGDPRGLETQVETVRQLLGRLPLLGVGLGHQVLALALGGSVERMRPGHHGLNYAVRDLPRGRCFITVQHHSFVVARDGLPEGVEVTHENVNDGSVEGIRSREHPAASVQFHPRPDEMGVASVVLRDLLAPGRGH